MRALSIATMLLLITTPTLAAGPKVESALNVLQAVGADANKLKAFCELMKLDEKLEGKQDLVLEAQVDKLLDQLGADFKVAWNTIEDTDERSPDGRALGAGQEWGERVVVIQVYGCDEFARIDHEPACQPTEGDTT